MATKIPSLSDLRKAIKIVEKINNLRSELHSVTGGVSIEDFQASARGSTGRSKAPADPSFERRGRSAGAKKIAKKAGITPEGRARIAAAQKRRWAAVRKGRTGK